jgi:TetR/AcrR family transcriptional regulator, transcriptional repressor for nem operon
MRVSKEKAAEHRRLIVDAAARLFREQGIGATGVDSITSAAGLTHGVVYSQFGSKEAIAIDSIRLALERSKRTWLRVAAKSSQRNTFRAIVESYLSASHRDAPGTGCLVAALGGDIARQSRSIRDAFTEEFKQALEFLAELMAIDNGPANRDYALAAFAAMSGALMLARAVSDPALSDRILKTTSAWVTRTANPGRAPRTRV